ncbi:hypothetical protein EDB80DRAFT_877117 [Ilyonectria destructans]|nr:hypothetical protein EDB80DRAFT_877117 [Ilyonectria destructans]
MASNTSNSTVNNESTTDNQRAARTTTSPDRAAEVARPGFSIVFVLGVLFVLPLGIALASLSRDSVGVSTRPDIPVIAYPNAARLGTPKIYLTYALHELELVVKKSQLQPLRVQAWTLDMMLRSLRVLSDSTPLSWRMKLYSKTHYKAVVTRLEWLASEFDIMLQKRMNLAKRLSEEKQGIDGVSKPLKEVVCAWSDELNLLVGKSQGTEELLAHQEEISTAYRQVFTMCAMVGKTWQDLLVMTQHLEHDDMEWLKAAMGRIKNWVEDEEHRYAITREDAIEADEMMKDLIEEYMEKLKLWYY